MGKLWDLLQSHIDGEKYPPSERQIAAKLGVSPTSMRKYRNPKQLPSRETMEAIANLVGVRYSVVLDAVLYDTGYHEAGKVVPLRVRPITTVEADLEVAKADLRDWTDQKLTGKNAESHRRELQTLVDELSAELAVSRSVLGDQESVAEL